MPGPPPRRGSAAYTAAVSSLKVKFRELDVNRDGMLDREELAALLRRGLPDITDKEVKGLFSRVDTDGSGAVRFDEFVDFLFAPPGKENLPAGTRPPRQLVDEAEAEMLRVVAEAKAGAGEPAPFCVELHGASYHPELNGEYVRKSRPLNGRPVYARSDPPYAIFYGWTPGRRCAGWFVASRTPPEGPVLKYVVCNSSPSAESPEVCSAMWVTFGGNPDKRMFCLAADVDADADELDVAAGAGEACDGLLEEELSMPASVTAAARADFEEELDQQLEEEAGEGPEGPEDLEDPEGLDDLDAPEERGPGWVDEEEGGARRLGPGSGPGPNDFVDPEFPPEESSLGSSMGIHDFDPSLCVANCWTRLPQLHEAPCLFHRGAAPDDICCAASAANRWFLSACVAVAEFPAWVRSMFGPEVELRPDGRYAVRLYHPGRRGFLRVEVDDLVPTKAGAAAFAGVTPEGELWVALVEKAFAKLCGSYAGTAGGSTAFGLLYLCGGGQAESWQSAGPGRWRRSHTEWRRGGERGAAVDRAEERLVEDWAYCDDGRLWRLLRDFTRRCYPATCSVRAAQAGRGLPADRTYTLVSTREVPLDGRALRMVFLRDPFGVSGWRGRWSAASEAWARSPAVRRALQFRPGGDGTFWMSFNDFVRYFGTIDVVRKAMPLQGCHRVKLAEFRDEADDDGAGSLADFDLPSLATSP